MIFETFNKVVESGRLFNVIYADPPWTFTTRSAKGKGRSAEQHYDCMTLDDIKALPVAEVASDNCALFLWVTDPCLKQGLEVMESWGFTYKTVGFTWVKQNQRSPTFFTGMGYYTRSNPEMCLLGTRGTMVRKDKGVPQLIVSPRGRHSEKPVDAMERIERLFDGPYLEMFAREEQEGWDSFGNEVRSDADRLAAIRELMQSIPPWSTP